MMKARQMIFSACVCFILCGPLLLFSSEKAGISIPEDLTAKSAQYLSGGMSNVDVRSSFSLQSIVDGEFQNVIEKEIDNYVPAKANALLQYAAIQRHGIEISNTLFNWSCYPTHYGSRYIYIPEKGALAGFPSTTAKWSGAESFFESLNDYARENTHMRFLVYIVAGREHLPDANPAFAMTSSSVPLSGFLEKVQKETSTPNITIETNCYLYDLETFYDEYFKSDLHWNIKGALRANEQITEYLGLSNMKSCPISKLDDALFSGTESRQSLCLICDEVNVAQDSFENLLIEKENGETSRGNEHLKYDTATQMQRFFDFYGQYYCDLENAKITGGYGDATVLLVADSYGSALERPLANACATLYHSDLLRGDRHSDATLDSQLQRDTIDTVIFVGRIRDFESFNSRNPSYWN